jgi:hypothetical protein
MIDISVALVKIGNIEAEMEEIRHQLEVVQDEDRDRPDNQEGMPQHHYKIASRFNDILTRLNGHTRLTLDTLIQSVQTLTETSKAEGDSWASQLRGEPAMNSENSEKNSMEGGKRNSRKGKNRKTRKNRSNRK